MEVLKAFLLPVAIFTLLPLPAAEKQPVPLKCIGVRATAYSNDPKSINVAKWRDGLTAVMAKADRGVIAVDPSVIPFGSVLWVEGYGYGIALDRGSAIKGYRIDLFFNTRKEALKWGVKKVKVCIIDRVKVKAFRKVLRGGV